MKRSGSTIDLPLEFHFWSPHKSARAEIEEELREAGLEPEAARTAALQGDQEKKDEMFLKAVREGNVADIKKWLEAEADPYAEGQYDEVEEYNALQLAALHGQQQAFEALLILLPPDMVEEHHKQQALNTGLVEAARRGDKATARWLQEKGGRLEVKVDVVDDHNSIFYSSIETDEGINRRIKCPLVIALLRKNAQEYHNILTVFPPEDRPVISRIAISEALLIATNLLTDSRITGLDEVDEAVRESFEIIAFILRNTGPDRAVLNACSEADGKMMTPLLNLMEKIHEPEPPYSGIHLLLCYGADLQVSDWLSGHRPLEAIIPDNFWLNLGNDTDDPIEPEEKKIRPSIMAGIYISSSKEKLDLRHIPADQCGALAYINLDNVIINPETRTALMVEKARLANDSNAAAELKTIKENFSKAAKESLLVQRLHAAHHFLPQLAVIKNGARDNNSPLSRLPVDVVKNILLPYAAGTPLPPALTHHVYNKTQVATAEEMAGAVMPANNSRRALTPEQMEQKHQEVKRVLPAFQERILQERITREADQIFGLSPEQEIAFKR